MPAKKPPAKKAKKSVKKDAPKMGRPTDYSPEIVDKILHLAGEGMIESAIMRKLGFSPSTIDKWKQQHADFRQALQKAKEIVDDSVVDALLKSARGWSHESIKIHFDKFGKVHVYRFVERFPPNPTSMIFWLKNRRRLDWRDITDRTVANPDGSPVNSNVVYQVTLPANGRTAEENAKAAVKKAESNGATKPLPQ